MGFRLYPRHKKDAPLAEGVPFGLEPNADAGLAVPIDVRQVGAAMRVNTASQPLLQHDIAALYLGIGSGTIDRPCGEPGHSPVAALASRPWIVG